ncbi:MAG: efflux RND transporter permease subunit [Desulfomonilaceae bacterium]
MNLVRWAAAHRRSLFFLLVVLSTGGVVTAFLLPVSLFPHTEFPRIVVAIDSGDRPAEQMVASVTMPAEQCIRAIPGLQGIRSTTSRGSSELSVNFTWGQDMSMALLQVESALNRILPTLPPQTTFTARRMDPTVFPVGAFSLTSAEHTLIQLRDIAQYRLLPLLSEIEGVARIGILGGELAEYRVIVDMRRLEAYGLKEQDVTQALSATNVLQAVGRLEDRSKLYLVLSDARLRNLDQVRETILRSGVDGFVQLEDVATVEYSVVPQWQTVTADGRDAVLILIYQQPTGNTVQIMRNVKSKLKAYQHNLPPAVTMSNWYDQSELITQSTANVRDTILVGIALAAVIIFAFLRNPKVTLLAVAPLPIVLAITILFLYVLGMSFNIMTLGGMAAAVGLILDDAIVMIEHIVRRFRSGDVAASKVIAQAAREFARPLVGSSFSTVIIFLPLALLGGVTGAFFKPLSMTMACALVISFFVVWFGIPILATHTITQKDAKIERVGGLTLLCQQGYRFVIEATLRRPWLLSVLLIPLAVGGYLGYLHVGSGFMPAMDEGGFVIDYRTAPGASLHETDRLCSQVEAILRTTPDVQSYSRRTGTQLGGGLTEANQGDFFVRLKPPPRRSVDAVMEALRREIEQDVPGLKIEMAQLMEDLIGDLTAVPQPIEIKLYGDDPNTLMKTAPNVAQAISQVPGVVEVRDGITLAGDALEIEIDRDRAALEGIDPATITNQLRSYLTGIVATQVQQGEKMIGIRVWTPNDVRSTTDDIPRLRLQSRDGHWFPLKHVAKVRVVTGQPQITRDNLKRMAAVTGRISGRDMGSTMADVQRALSGQGLIPPTIYYELGGLYKQQRIAFAGMIAVFAGAVALVFLLLLYLYERFRVAVAVLAMPLIAMCAVFLGLWITGTELNITSMMGATMVIGIVTEVAIFYFSEYQDLRIAGLAPQEALVQAGVNRMRPIAMTTLAAIMALFPLALGLGQGAAMQRPLAIAIVSGLTIQVPLVLIVMPVVFHRLLDRGGSIFATDAKE